VKVRNRRDRHARIGVIGGLNENGVGGFSMNKDTFNSILLIIFVFGGVFLYGGIDMVLSLIGVLLTIAIIGGIVVFLPIGGMRR